MSAPLRPNLIVVDNRPHSPTIIGHVFLSLFPTSLSLFLSLPLDSHLWAETVENALSRGKRIKLGPSGAPPRRPPLTCPPRARGLFQFRMEADVDDGMGRGWRIFHPFLIIILSPPSYLVIIITLTHRGGSWCERSQPIACSSSAHSESKTFVNPSPNLPPLRLCFPIKFLFSFLVIPSILFYFERSKVKFQNFFGLQKANFKSGVEGDRTANDGGDGAERRNGALLSPSARDEEASRGFGRSSTNAKGTKN